MNSKIERIQQEKKIDSNMAWAKAVGEFVKEVRKTAYKELKENKISAKKLFILSAWSLRELISTVNHSKYLVQDLHLIDEQRFIQALMDAVLKKRKTYSISKNCRTDSGIIMNGQTKRVVRP